MKVLQVDNLSKSFGRNQVLKDISFDINEGEIVGLLGRNGSGKSTMMKCICGLMSYQNGDIEIAGYDIEKEKINALENIGVSIESPALYPNLSGLDHLEQMAAWRKQPKEKVDEMVEYSGIGKYIKRRTYSYSMGMKMRLMLSMVMIHDPKFLILDEPMNGLDPDGVIDLRQKLLNLKEKGTSILISSHQLSELEKLVDRVVMIEKGDIVYDGKISDEIIAESQYSIDVSDEEVLKSILEKMGVEYFIDNKSKSYEIIAFNADSHVLNSVLNKLTENNVEINDILKKTVSLEDLYSRIIH